jgi:hypothetical protein
MSVIFHVLKEEYERLLEAEGSYTRAIASMPRGAPRIRQVRKRKYLYLEYRRGNHVVHEYIGPEDTEKAKKTLEQVAQRRRYEKLLKETKHALRDVRKALRGKI